MLGGAVRRCSRCNTFKPPTKFYASMTHCKACHNGITEANLRRATEIKDRQDGEPDEGQIAEACRLIRQQWSLKKRESRKRGRLPA